MIRNKTLQIDLAAAKHRSRKRRFREYFAIKKDTPNILGISFL